MSNISIKLNSWSEWGLNKLCLKVDVHLVGGCIQLGFKSKWYIKGSIINIVSKYGLGRSI